MRKATLHRGTALDGFLSTVDRNGTETERNGKGTVPVVASKPGGIDRSITVRKPFVSCKRAANKR